MDKSKYDIKAKLLNFNDLGKTSHKTIDREAFMKTLGSAKVQERLHDGKLLGLLTHDGRKRARKRPELTHTDWILKDEDLCNILKEVTVDGDTVYGYFKLTETPAAYRLKGLLQEGSKIAVSISTELTSDGDKFYIQDFNGVDFTMRPEFDTEIVERNFSESDGGRLDFSYPEFSFYTSPTEAEVSITGGDFSEEVTSVKEVEGDFSLRDYLVSRKRRPLTIFRTMVNEVILFAKTANSSKVQVSKKDLRFYLSSYLSNYCAAALASENKNFNVVLELGLNTYCRNRNAPRELQLALKRVKTQSAADPSISRQNQKKLNESFKETMTEIYKYINRKLPDAEKHI